MRYAFIAGRCPVLKRFSCAVAVEVIGVGGQWRWAVRLDGF